MRRPVPLLALLLAVLAPATLHAQEPGGSRLLGILPAEGLVGPSAFVFRAQAALDAHYLLADESVLGLDGKAEAAFARYRAGEKEALLVVVAYPAIETAENAYGRFGKDFFPKFDGAGPRTVERLETGDYAAAARVASVLIIVLEAPDRESCAALLARAEASAKAYLR